jgi:hypothetical protein
MGNSGTAKNYNNGGVLRNIILINGQSDNQPSATQGSTVQRITVNYSWQNGAAYYFRVLASTGQNLPWIEQASTV